MSPDPRPSPGLLPTPPPPYQSPLNLYFENIPPGWSYLALRKMFAKHLHVHSVYVSPNLNKAGRRFGFLKLHACPNLSNLENWLSSFWIGSYKLIFNKARFNHRNLSPQRLKPSTHPLPPHKPPLKVRDHRSYVEVTKGPPNLHPHDPKLLINTKPKSVTKTKPSTLKPTMIFNSIDENLDWLAKCAVGTLQSPERIPSLHAMFECEGVFDISVTPMGGNMVLLEFNFAESMNYYVSD